MFRWFLLFVSFTVLGQVQYEFDTVFVYEGNFKNFSDDLLNERRYYYTNSENSGYFMVICLRDNRDKLVVFRNNNKNKIAEFNIKSEAILELSKIKVSDAYLKNNSYQNPITYRHISKEERRLNDSVVKYTYNINRGENFKIQTFNLIVKETETDMPLGIGFADYYSLFPLGKNEPDGLIINSTTSTRSETILSAMSLVEISSKKLILTFEN